MKNGASIVFSSIIALLFTAACSQNAPQPATPSKAAAPPKAAQKLSANILKRIEGEFVPIAGGILPGNFLGKFVVGSAEKEAKPVRVASFWMSRHEVTQGEWSEVMSTTPPDSQEVDLPVSNVTWHDTQKFISRLNDASVTPIFRLPSAAEWAYSCRAGRGGPFENPKEAALTEHEWWGKNSGGRVHPVARLKPNLWSLYDMLGNVKEWCSDESERQEGYSLRPVAGASFENHDSSDFRCSVNGTLADNESQPNIGFRLARSYRPGEKASSPKAKKARVDHQ